MAIEGVAFMVLRWDLKDQGREGQSFSRLALEVPPFVGLLIPTGVAWVEAVVAPFITLAPW